MKFLLVFFTLFLGIAVVSIKAIPGGDSSSREEENSTVSTSHHSRQGRIPTQPVTHVEIDPDDKDAPVDMNPRYTQHTDSNGLLYYIKKENDSSREPLHQTLFQRVWSAVQSLFPGYHYHPES